MATTNDTSDEFATIRKDAENRLADDDVKIAALDKQIETKIKPLQQERAAIIEHRDNLKANLERLPKPKNS
jgi:hypothetical protein